MEFKVTKDRKMFQIWKVLLYC